MGQTEILEGSKIICVFMDGEVMEDGMCWFGGYHHIRTTNKCFHIKAVKYHSSFDWLIPAIVKFRNLDLGTSLFASHVQAIDDSVTDEYDINQAFGMLVEAIKWYNSLKP